MLRKIFAYGTIGGLVVAGGMFAFTMPNLQKGHADASYMMAIGYLTMLVALSTVFIGVKRHRDIVDNMAIFAKRYAAQFYLTRRYRRDFIMVGQAKNGGLNWAKVPGQIGQARLPFGASSGVKARHHLI